MTAPDRYDVAAQVVTQWCGQTSTPLDTHFTAQYFRDLLPRVREDSRPVVETTISVLDEMTEATGERGHTIADIILFAVEKTAP